MSAIDKNVLRLGLFELKYFPGAIPRIAINEAIELAKDFGTDDSGRFVNAVLDNI